MTEEMSANTKAALLLTAPLLVGRSAAREPAELMSPGDYKKLRHRLVELGRQPSDLLGREAEALAQKLTDLIEPKRLRSLLARGFLLAQAIERWHGRTIWVMSRADAGYPRRLKERLKENAPIVLYGCGDVGLLDRGGLAVVGSRAANKTLLEYATAIGKLAGQAGLTLVSGGAKGVDRAAMGGALESGGQAVGVLSDSLENAALNREWRQSLLDGRLTLVSPFDPLAPFAVGNAMQRNKVVYGVADAGLVVCAELGEGGTWAGAVEQIKKYGTTSLFVRATGETSEALKALTKMGARAWPEPTTPDELRTAIASDPVAAVKRSVFLFDNSLPTASAESAATGAATPPPAKTLFHTVRGLVVELLRTPMSEQEISAELGAVKSQTTAWLKQLVADGVITKKGKPVRYSVAKASGQISSVQNQLDNARGKEVASK